MSEIFLTLLNRAIAAGWLMAALLFLRPLLKKCPAWVRCLLWGIVAVRLVLPVHLESVLSLVPSAETLSLQTVRYDTTPQITSGIPALNAAVNNAISNSSFAVTQPSESVNQLYLWSYIAGCVWAIGLAALLGHALLSLLKTRRCIREAVRLRENVWLCDAVRSPFILGLIRPQIYLPSGLDEGTMEQVLAHERAHLARRDHWWKALGYALFAVYWFQPLCILAYCFFCRDLELACDERVVRHLDDPERAVYLHALVDCSVARRSLLACPLAFGEVGVAERVRRLLHYKKPTLWVVLSAVLLCIVVTACFLTDPISKRPDGDSIADLPPMLHFGEQSYVAPYKPVTHLPNGYVLAGQLTAEQAGDTGLVGHDYYLAGGDDPDSPADLYVWGEYGTPVSIDMVDSTTRSWAWLRWTPTGVDSGAQFSLDDVLFLADRGDALCWEDFDGYTYTEGGSGLCIYTYEVDTLFDVMVGGPRYPEAMYFYLRADDGTDAMIDLREGQAAVAAFIAAHKENAIQNSTFDLTGKQLTFTVPKDTTIQHEVDLWTNSTCIHVEAEGLTGDDVLEIVLYNTVDLDEPILYATLRTSQPTVLFSNLTSASTYRVGAVGIEHDVVLSVTARSD